MLLSSSTKTYLKIIILWPHIFFRCRKSQEHYMHPDEKKCMICKILTLLGLRELGW